MNVKIFLIAVALLIVTVSASGQLRVSPNIITTKDSITVYYNPTKGNKQLAGTNPIYIYTGLITLKSENKADWQYTPMQWGDNNSIYTLHRLNDTCYYYGINIKKFYNLGDQETVYRIGLYFRNSDYSQMGFTEDNDYFYIDFVQTGFNFKSYTINDNQLIINTDQFVYTLDIYENNLVKFDFHKNGNLSASQKLSVLKKQENIKFDIKENDSNLVIQREDFTTIINKQPVSFELIRQSDTIVKNLKINNNFGWRYEFDSTSRIYGGGINTPQLDNNNGLSFLYNRANYGYNSKEYFSNCTIPFFISSDLYSIYFDSPSRGSIDFGKYSKGIANYYNYSNPAPIYIEIGNSCEELVSDFTSIVGRQPLPAYWTLGFLQSNFAFWNQYDITKRLPLYKQNKIPCEAIMIDFFWSGGDTKMGDFEWDYANNYPKPAELIAALRNNNMKCLLISEPYVAVESKNFQNFFKNNLFSKQQDGKPYVLVGHRRYDFGIVDLFNPSAKSELWNLHKAKYDDGIAGWWCDLSEPEAHPEDMFHYGGYNANEIHNLYPYMWAEFIYENYAKYKPNGRPVHFYRGGFSGMQKYGAFVWTGDVESSFDGLKIQIPIMLGLGISGMTMVGSDVGGFAAKKKNSLLYTRWLQYAAFSPLLRPHSNNVQPPEPFYHEEPYLSICRKYIELRYKLLPYIYTLCYDATTTGRPLVMQMDYFDIQNKELQNINTQYFFGRDFIVAPILDSLNTREVILPKGTWYEFKNNKRYLGEQIINVDYDINDIPIFVRAGAIIPTTYSVLSTELFKYDYYKFLCYADSSISESEGKVFIDDGKSANSIEQNAYELITVKMKNQLDKLTFELTKEGLGFKDFSDAVFEMQVFNTIFFESVFLNSALLPLYDSYSSFENSNLGVYYNAQENILHIKYPWNHQKNNLIECIRSANVNAQENTLIYPNPTDGKIAIKLSDKGFALNIVDVSLYSVSGNKILSWTNEGQKIIEFDFTKHKLSFGTYFIEIKTADKIIKHKIIYVK